jgi:hypothetical protein
MVAGVPVRFELESEGASSHWAHCTAQKVYAVYNRINESALREEHFNERKCADGTRIEAWDWFYGARGCAMVCAAGAMGDASQCALSNLCHAGYMPDLLCWQHCGTNLCTTVAVSLP